MKNMYRVFLSLGSNQGRRKSNLIKGKKLLVSMVGDVKRCSSIYETKPWGCTHQKNFFNQVMELMTANNPFELLKKLKNIEKLLGRLPAAEKYAARSLDLDILLFEDRVLSDPMLKIPHPLMHLRKFVLVPFVEIAPEVTHPVFKKTMKQLLQECEDDDSPLRIS
jgi:2-amino-4-hydroxy-6-hydroxymethyldihydropteridine diphosphokinase